MSKIVEEWRPVVGYEGLYEVSDWGNVRSVDRTFEYYNRGNLIKRTFKGQPLKKILNFEGYHIVTLSDANHKQRQGKVHRLVAVAWLPIMKDPEGFFEKMAANREKAYEKIKIKVIQINNNTGEILKIWDSAADVERELGIYHSNITACCKGKKKSAGGFKWKYYEN